MATKTKRAVIDTNVEAGTLTFHEPVAAPADSKGPKWLPGRTIATIHCDSYPDAVKRLAMLTVGFRNKFMDTYADPEADIAACLARMDAQLRDGEWDAAGPGAERTTLAIEAYASVIGRDVAFVKSRFAAMAADGRQSEIDVRLKHPQVVALVARIQQERAAQRAKAAKANATGADAVATLD